MKKFANGNYLCCDCNKNVIDSPEKLTKLFRQVRNLMQQKLNFPADHPIKLELKDFPSDSTGNVREFGLYTYKGREIVSRPSKLEIWRDKTPKVRYEDEQCTIVVMNCLPAFKAAEVIAHELAHDYMQHYWRYIKSDMLREGFAEFISASYNSLTGNEKWNFRMEINPDKVYGDGYRLIKKYYQKGSWKAVWDFLHKTNQKDMPEDLKH